MKKNQIGLSLQAFFLSILLNACGSPSIPPMITTQILPTTTNTGLLGTKLPLVPVSAGFANPVTVSSPLPAGSPNYQSSITISGQQSASITNINTSNRLQVALQPPNSISAIAASRSVAISCAQVQVDLIANNNSQGSTTIYILPMSQTGNVAYSQGGLCAGASATPLIDFSSNISIGQSSGYSVKVSNVKTDACTTSFYTPSGFYNSFDYRCWNNLPSAFEASFQYKIWTDRIQ